MDGECGDGCAFVKDKIGIGRKCRRIKAFKANSSILKCCDWSFSCSICFNEIHNTDINPIPSDPLICSYAFRTKQVEGEGRKDMRDTHCKEMENE